MNKLILITGGSASGKSHLASMLIDYLGDKAIWISQDNFYKPKGTHKTNYDEPIAFDFITQNKKIKNLVNNKPTKIPIYSFKKHDVIGEKTILPVKYIILEGVFTFSEFSKELKPDFKIFIDTPADIRLSRRILRDVEKRGRIIQNIIIRWNSQVQPSYKKYISHLRNEADIVIPWHKLNERSIKSILSSIINLDKDISEIVNQ